MYAFSALVGARPVEIAERFWRCLAWLLPRRLCYWAFIRIAAEATTTKFRDQEPDNVSIMQALQSWEAGDEHGENCSCERCCE